MSCQVLVTLHSTNVSARSIAVCKFDWLNQRKYVHWEDLRVTLAGERTYYEQLKHLAVLV